MSKRVRPSEQIHQQNEITQACPTERRDKLLTDARDVYYTVGVQRVRSATFFIGEFFGDDLASYRNSSISCLKRSVERYAVTHDDVVYTPHTICVSYSAMEP